MENPTSHARDLILRDWLETEQWFILLRAIFLLLLTILIFQVSPLSPVVYYGNDFTQNPSPFENIMRVGLIAGLLYATVQDVRMFLNHDRLEQHIRRLMHSSQHIRRLMHSSQHIPLGVLCVICAIVFIVLMSNRGLDMSYIAIATILLYMGMASLWRARQVKKLRAWTEKSKPAS